MQFTTSQLNNSGSIALSGTSTTATTLIGGGIGGNVGSLTNNSGNIVNITTTALSNSGTITNAGTSSNPMTISAAITGSAASLVQSSSTSTLILSAANTFGGGVTIKSGTLQVNTGTTSMPSAAAPSPWATPPTRGPRSHSSSTASKPSPRLPMP